MIHGDRVEDMPRNPDVMTVLGPIHPDALGVTLSHEHAFLDLTNQFTEPDDPRRRSIGQQKVSRDDADLLQRDPYAIKDNLLLDDLSLALEEVARYKAAGGSTITECTSVGIHRDPEKLRRLAQGAGINVIAGCGYYTWDTHPRGMGERLAADIAEEIVRDLTVGIEKTGVRAGVIGEIGISNPMHRDEQKNLVAAALAHQRTGVGIQVHTFPWGKTGLEASDLLLEHGVTPSKIVICHTDVVLDQDYIRSLLDRGVTIQFDNFGKEFPAPADAEGFAGGAFASDNARVKTIGSLVRLGYEGQILITNDICFKCMLHRFGGRGYDHVLRTIPHMLLEEGVPEKTLSTFLVANPRRFLTPTA